MQGLCKAQNNKVYEFETNFLYYFSTTSTKTGVPTDAAQSDAGLTCSEDYIVVRGFWRNKSFLKTKIGKFLKKFTPYSIILQGPSWQTDFFRLAITDF